MGASSSSGSFSKSTVSPVKSSPNANRRGRRRVWRKGLGATYEYDSAPQTFFSRMGKLVPAKAHGNRTDWACKVQLSSRREDLS